MSCLSVNAEIHNENFNKVEDLLLETFNLKKAPSLKIRKILTKLSNHICRETGCRCPCMIYKDIFNNKICQNFKYGKFIEANPEDAKFLNNFLKKNQKKIFARKILKKKVRFDTISNKTNFLFFDSKRRYKINSFGASLEVRYCDHTYSEIERQMRSGDEESTILLFCSKCQLLKRKK